MPIIAGVYSLSESSRISRPKKIIQSMLSDCIQISLYETQYCSLATGYKPQEQSLEVVSTNPMSGLVLLGRIHTFNELSGKPTCKSIVDYIVDSKDLILSSKGRWLANNVWGNYIIVLVDDKKRRVWIFRDPTGLASLFYIKTEDFIIFASQLSALTAAVQETLKLDYEFLSSYVIWGSHTTPRTPLQGVRELEPGNMMEISMSGARTDLFWNPTHYIDVSQANKTMIGVSLGEILQNILAICIKGTKGVYLDLSGGIDSSALLASLANPKRTNSINLIAATVYHPSIASASELNYAREVANSLNMDLVELNGEDYLPFSELFNLKRHRKWDRPSAQLLQLSLHEKHAATARQFRCDSYINGFGGDQLFQAKTGSPIYLCDYVTPRKLKKLLYELRSTCKQEGIPYISAL